jgi:hypothetical protein
MAGVQELPTDPEPIVAVDFLRGEGAQAADPAADTLVVFMPYGTFLYNPSGAAGAAGGNGPYGPWHRLCSGGQCSGASAGLVTAAGTVLIGSRAGAVQLARGADRGRTWTVNYEDHNAYPIFESARTGPDGGPPVILIGAGPYGTARSFDDGAPGTWEPRGTACCFAEALAEVPPSPSLPGGRVLLGGDEGVWYSDDGSLSYAQATGPGARTSMVRSFTFVPAEGHPYGSTAFAGVHDFAPPHGGESRGATVLRSDDGGATWAIAHQFTASELGLPPYAGSDVTDVTVYATGDGALWAGVGFSGGAAAGPPRGGVVRSVDGGTTWSRADAGFRDGTGRGYAVNQFALSRTGVLYAATTRGVWRTTTAVVAGEAGPNGAPGGVGVSVRPNPAGGRVEVVVSLAEAGLIRVVVLDALGREVAVVLDGEGPAGERAVPVDTSGWPAGVYVVRVEAGGRVSSARLVVAR